MEGEIIAVEWKKVPRSEIGREQYVHPPAFIIVGYTVRGLHRPDILNRAIKAPKFMLETSAVTCCSYV